MTVTKFQKGGERYFIVHNRETTVKLLKIFYDAGYKWVTRDFESDYLNLFNLKPKKYLDVKIWGYRNPEHEGIMMMESVKNTDITEIRWQNRQPIELEQFIKDNEKQ